MQFFSEDAGTIGLQTTSNANMFTLGRSTPLASKIRNADAIFMMLKTQRQAQNAGEARSDLPGVRAVHANLMLWLDLLPCILCSICSCELKQFKKVFLGAAANRL
jgi:hypothetical protein